MGIEFLTNNTNIVAKKEDISDEIRNQLIKKHHAIIEEMTAKNNLHQEEKEEEI